jgi:hypothetical protein
MIMNNNLYHWHDEQMVKHEMQEVRHAVEQERLLREAGLTRPSPFVRVAKVLSQWLSARRIPALDSASRVREAKRSKREKTGKALGSHSE